MEEHLKVTRLALAEPNSSDHEVQTEKCGN